MGKQAFDGPRGQHFFELAFAPWLVIIGLDTDDGPEHALYDDDIKLPLDEGLVASIKKRGVLEPILVRKDGHRTLVLDGRQRVRACREACEQLAKELGFDLNDALKAMRADPDGEVPVWFSRLPRVPVILKKPVDDKDAMGMVVAANIRPERAVMGKAMKAQRMLDKGMSMKEIAEDMGVTTAGVGGWLRLLQLSDKMKAAIGKTITASAAVQYADLPAAEQDKILDAAAVSGTIISVPEARRQRTERAAGKTNGASHGSPVGIGALRKLYNHEEFMSKAPVEVKQFLGWVCGDKAIPRISGMTKALKDIGLIDAGE